LLHPRSRTGAGPGTVVRHQVEKDEHTGEEGYADDGTERDAESAT
jgi:hypothetical protein